ncbi:nuclear transport factor 2 family protein [Micromonospora maris]|uniref:nuclear transport factor 2 family protein n=2 Tax=Micromonospora maris TaxID=1003110 RepID=UPI0009DAA1C8|nr:nuclear transport factor 2 family protein [Micromonospora maris]
MRALNLSPDQGQPLGRWHPVHRHLPVRPGWSCGVCAAPWPCPRARMLLRVEYGADRVGLSVYLAGMLFDATGDLLRHTGGPLPAPEELFDRFLAWTAPQPRARHRAAVSQPGGRTPGTTCPRSMIMDVRDAAQRWADAWAHGWPAKDVESIVTLQATDGVHWASLFRPCRGRDGLRAYVEECFGEETRPAEVWFAAPRCDGATATVEYWAITYPYDAPLTISGCTLLRFDADALVAESRDYSHTREGRFPPPAGIFD